MKQGFSLIEFLLYFGLFTLLLSFTMHWVVLTHRTISKANQDSDQLLILSKVQELIAHDIRQATMSMGQWKVVSEHRYVWTVGDYDVGWELIDSSLMRVEGMYSVSTGGWLKCSRCLAAEHIKDFCLSNQRRSGLIECFVQGNTVALQRSCMIRNGELS